MKVKEIVWKRYNRNTMNAKELILAKINATADFADAWTYLISTGRTPEEI